MRMDGVRKLSRSGVGFGGASLGLGEAGCSRLGGRFESRGWTEFGGSMRFGGGFAGVVSSKRQFREDGFTFSAWLSCSCR